MNVIGEIKLFAGAFTPPDFVDCDGTAYPIPLYKELFCVLGFSYTDTGSSGTEGLKYFNVPNLNRLAPGTKYVICINGYFPRDRRLEIYTVPTSTLTFVPREGSTPQGKIDNKFEDSKGKKLTTYAVSDWQNYNLDTDEYERPL
jgi:hypothetical protein